MIITLPTFKGTESIHSINKIHILTLKDLSIQLGHRVGTVCNSLTKLCVVATDNLFLSVKNKIWASRECPLTLFPNSSSYMEGTFYIQYLYNEGEHNF
ncbi:hypothetical protein FKM82_014616 [Ascaphus truei]